MKLYSDFAPRRTRQIVADVLAILGIGLWVWFGVAVYQLVMGLAGFGKLVADSGTGFKETMVEVGEILGGVPLIGGGIRIPFDGASDAGRALEAAGAGQQAAVAQLATVLGIGIALLPVLTILVLWLWPRLRFARRAATARDLAASPMGVDLLALRALATHKLPALSAVDPDAIGAWRRGDDGVLQRLAALELRSAGVRMPGA
jgi:hypothetical protein